MKLLTAAILDGYSPRKDKSIGLRFVTQEKTSGEVADIHSMLESFGYLYFRAEEKLSKDEIEALDKLDTDLYDQPKTQSQRLRNTLYMVWQQEKVGEFKDFYKNETERIIQHYKNKLEE